MTLIYGHNFLHGVILMADSLVSLQVGRQVPKPWRDCGQKVFCISSTDTRRLFVAFAGDYHAASHVIDFLATLLLKKPRLGAFPIFRQRVGAIVKYAYEHKFGRPGEKYDRPLSLIFAGIDYSRRRGQLVAFYETLMAELHTNDFVLKEAANLHSPICVAGSGEPALQDHIESFRNLQFGRVTALEYQASIIQYTLKNELNRLKIDTVGRIFHGAIMDAAGVRPIGYLDVPAQQGVRWEPSGFGVRYDVLEGNEQILLPPNMVLNELQKGRGFGRAL